jgi:hypothetical protein
LHSVKNKEGLLDFFNKFFGIVKRKVHGCIVVVLDPSNPNKTFWKGNWLMDPIDFFNSYSAVQQTNNGEDIIKLESDVDLAIELLNNDGITAFSTDGKLIAYNIFIKSKTKTKSPGGARRRAAETIISERPNGCLGVYFQSQDGDSFYKEII